MFRLWDLAYLMMWTPFSFLRAGKRMGFSSALPDLLTLYCTAFSTKGLPGFSFNWIPFKIGSTSWNYLSRNFYVLFSLFIYNLHQLFFGRPKIKDIKKMNWMQLIWIIWNTLKIIASLKLWLQKSYLCHFKYLTLLIICGGFGYLYVNRHDRLVLILPSAAVWAPYQTVLLTSGALEALRQQFSACGLQLLVGSCIRYPA